MKKIKFYMLCGNKKGQYIQVSDGYEIKVAERPCAISQNKWGCWTATDIETGLAYPVSECFDKRKDLVDWLHYKEQEFEEAYKKVLDKDGGEKLKWASRRLEELKEDMLHED